MTLYSSNTYCRIPIIQADDGHKYSETSIHCFSGDRKIRTIHTGNVSTGKPLKIIDKNNLMIIITSC
jgi:hypothetical protein